MILKGEERLLSSSSPNSPGEVLDNQSLVFARESRNQALGSTTQAPVKIWAAHHVSNQINSHWRRVWALSDERCHSAGAPTGQ